MVSEMGIYFTGWLVCCPLGILITLGLLRAKLITKDGAMEGLILSLSAPWGTIFLAGFALPFLLLYVLGTTFESIIDKVGQDL